MSNPNYGKCQVCGEERKFSRLGVSKRDISANYRMKDGIFIINYLYCKDKTYCAEKAKEICIKIKEGEK